MSNEECPNPSPSEALSQKISDDLIDLSKAVPLAVVDSEAVPKKRFFCGYEMLPYDQAAPFVQEEYYGGVNPDINKEKIPPRPTVAPPLPKALDRSASIPPEIGVTQSLPPLRVTCQICKSAVKGVPTSAHDCTQFQD
jgi:hypothetical protein